ncbi:YALIA101S02e04258g1_1 [Yarrowia lipolytica]|jgi:release factor glutamine methyltransferase|nr:eRF1 methyltransferase catalytic subunit MTQ2 [Yarrowia lipolytica]SEI31882.1 YALIA101S02e04258g1_1 [Yarrowia lipolytica]
MSFPTPSTSSANYEEVYEPSEDSFMLLDVLEMEQSYINSHLSYPVVTEIGTGSGIVTTFMLKSVVPKGVFLATDISPFACNQVLATSKENNGTQYLEALRGERTTMMRPHTIDLLVFNPPYVPDDKPVEPYPETYGDWVDWALLGGEDGMQVTWKVLLELKTILSKNGIAYILFCASNKPEQVAVKMRELGWIVTRIVERKEGRELLSVYRFELK